MLGRSWTRGYGPASRNSFERQMTTNFRNVFIGLAMGILVFAVVMGFHYASKV
jgi:hypothetical protein